VLREFNVAKVKLKLSKPGAVRGANAVGVIIKRRRESLAQPVRDGIVDETPVTLPPAIAALASPTRPAAGKRKSRSKFSAASCQAYLSLGSNIEPENNLRIALAALRARFGEVVVSPVYRTSAVGFEGPDFLNAVAIIDSDIHPFALNDWLHALEEALGRDRRDASYSDRPLDIDIIYFGDLVLDGPGEFQLPRPELRHAFVLKPLADVAPEFVDPIRNATLAQLWAAHPEHGTPPQQVALQL
jgi:2-amino-4-hydroxy-6-hydroxymethyldihydropteridine diphosphokinase